MSPLLLIDGDQNFRQALAIALRLDGHAVSAVPSVEAAERELASGEFGCCVIDVRLAGAAGLLGRMARSSRACVVATAFDPDLLAETLARHPEVAALEKPFRVEDLRAVLGPRASIVA
ncbi:response regulator [Anaeromyxobacter paludicola]|uniref:Response regulatory domain-containing protein n=1 Tax=Anaeromyxobacter paludicola TaxID=2918171 RepID=A0ABN6NAB0_9BACT|nr:response regulator [Anaeromyxobacter paludicola]BDG10163.1 hypothetical protein AMPC_32760 [Anaeromyxobacter paludicola]